MKKLIICILTLAILLTFNACELGEKTNDTNDTNDTLYTTEEIQCAHEFSKGYCLYCKDLDPNCEELTIYNYTDYLDIKYRIANVDGSNGGSYGFVAFPYIYLSTSATSSRITFYNVSIEVQITVQQYIYDSAKYEECTVTVNIPVSLFGEGDANKRLDREDHNPVVIKNTFISEYKIISVTGCVSVD